MNTRKHIAGVSVALALFVGSIFGQAALAQTSGGTSATVSITGGALAVTIGGGTYGSFAYQFADRNVTSPFTITASDLRGTGAGWEVTISATNFTGVNNTFDIDNLLLDNTGSTFIAGDPVSGVTATDVTLATTSQTIISAPEDEGEGSYSFAVAGNLTIPGQTRVDNYTSTVTVAIATAP